MIIRNICLNAENTKVALLSTKGNLMCTVSNTEHVFGNDFVIIHKKYFNQIHQNGFVEGRVRRTDDGILLFEGFNWR